MSTSNGESGGSYARTNFDRLAQGSTSPREMGQGGPRMPRERKIVVASRAQKAAENSTISQMPFVSHVAEKRLSEYRKLIDGVLSDSISPERQREILDDIYRRYGSDLKTGGFVSLTQMERVLNELHEQDALNSEGESQWEAMMAKHSIYEGTGEATEEKDED